MAYEYKVGGQTVALEVDPSVVAVKFKDELPRSARAHATKAAGAGPFATRYEVPDEKLTIVPVAAAPVGPAAATMNAAIHSLNAQPAVSQARPVFRVDGNQVVAADRVILGLDDPSQAEDLAARHGLKLLRRRDDKVVCEIPDGTDVFTAVAALDAEPAVRFAEPDFVTIGRHIPKNVTAAVQPLFNDPMIKDQYAMKITRAVDAWHEQKGDAAIRIAILDEGVDTQHPDLATKIVGTFDAADNDSYQDPNAWDGHGTACAGLAAGIGNNSIGIRGVASGCSLMAARIAYSKHKGGPWVTTNEAIANAISWSWKNGAAVLSNSWGGGVPSNDITEEFERARKQGRNGKGCVIVIAAGNSYEKVSFPATLPDVLTVSASNEYDEAKTPSSMDGESWWGTNHGPEVDVAAPGVHNLTTDIHGADGYIGGDYEPKFNGTSSSTPIVAGACALVLSANPNLSEAEVRALIKDNTDQVGSYPYVNNRNDFFGNGRLNVYKAVKAAKAMLAH